MVQEHRRLEETLKRALAGVEHGFVHGGKEQDLVDKIQLLTLEREPLNSQKAELHAAILQHTKFQQLIQKESFTLLNQDRRERVGDEEDRSHLQDPRDVNRPTNDRGGGWWVHFTDGSPPFYFYPFSREVADESDPFSPKRARNWPAESPIGTFMGWNLHQTKLVRDGNLPLLRVKLSKQFQCSIEDVYNVTCNQRNVCRPALVVAKYWKFNQRCEVVLQVFKAQWELPGGKRKMCFSMTAVDSEDNQRSRDAASLQENVEWLTEGGVMLTLTETDGGDVDAVYEQWAPYESEAQAASLLIQWTQFVIRWEQVALPSNVFLQ
ncbi:hypothetical protein Pcac1_g5198 [Phytophthora cactorum]|uniref:Uncharacterized protein n=4 Tax=Phytophthora cactorum TaxID=29920 RepID=A0A329SW05_9STRA|nr:hypothetical protein Pcac1_g5198 [Phytophthora cactorum]RAW41303.1 hypothetical protein PC110_g2494 [Phytophthora cactorum]